MIVSRAPSPEPARKPKPRQKRKGNQNVECEAARRGGGNDIPASRPITESFSQFDPDTLTRYLKPIVSSRSAHDKQYAGEEIRQPQTGHSRRQIGLERASSTPNYDHIETRALVDHILGHSSGSGGGWRRPMSISVFKSSNPHPKNPL